MIRGTTLLALLVVLGLACVFGKGADTEKSQESSSVLHDIDPKVASGPGDEEENGGRANDPGRWRFRYRFRSGSRRRHRPYPSRRPYPPYTHRPPTTQKPHTPKPCSTSRPDGIQWVNEWRKYLDFECPKGQTLIFMKSDFRDCHHDRIWAFGCGYNEASYQHCFWEHGYANDPKQGIYFNCPNHGFISGIKSEYTAVGDRRYKFKCCNDERFDHDACHQSPQLNKAGQNFEFKVDRDKRDYITGISSCFDHDKKDRVWKVDYCKSVEEVHIQPEKKDVIKN